MSDRPKAHILVEASASGPLPRSRARESHPAWISLNRTSTQTPNPLVLIHPSTLGSMFNLCRVRAQYVSLCLSGLFWCVDIILSYLELLCQPDPPSHWLPSITHFRSLWLTINEMLHDTVEGSFQVRQTVVHACSFTNCCVSLSKLLHLSEFQFHTCRIVV